MQLRHSFITCPGFLQYQQMIYCCSAHVLVDVIGLVNSLSALTHSVRVLFLTVRPSHRICRFIGKWGQLTVWNEGLLWHKTKCLSFALQVVPKLVRHFRSTPQGNLTVSPCWGQKWVFPFCVLLWFVIVVRRIFVGLWWVRLQVFVCCLHFCFWKSVVRLFVAVDENV